MMMGNVNYEDHTCWSSKVFQAKLACLLALSFLTVASLLHTTSFSLTTAGWQPKDHSNNSKITATKDHVSAGQLVPNGKDSSELALDELFAPESDTKTCLSRLESPLFQKPSPHKPSAYLLSKLRSYEHLHKLCGPYTKPYNESLQQLNSGPPLNSTACKYVIYASMSGLGNKMLTLSSAFLYALLTNRVLLVQFPDDSSNLFCEPFPNTTWLLPSDHILGPQIAHTFDQKYPHTYGNMLKNKTLDATTIKSSPFLLLYLAYNIDKEDGFFYCDKNQAQIQSVPWLVITSNQYFVPSLFLMESFKNELTNMFPDKETVFHFLGRYLFQPSNEVWGLITRFYQAYLARADQRIGIQVRVLNTTKTPFQTVVDQILSCTLNQKLLPQALNTPNSPPDHITNNHSLKAVLITSLYSEYYEHIRDLYWTKATETGEVIGIFQPSHEGYEQYGNNMHNMKALAEMYLLSMSDVLVTSAISTFGYVAQGLGGLKPWILYLSSNGKTPNLPCGQAMSMEPCFHFPPKYDCSGEAVDVSKVVSHVKHCEDADWGVTINDGHD